MLPIILPGHLTQKGVEIKPMSLPQSLPYLKVIYEKEDIKPPNLELTSWIKGQYRHDLLDPNFIVTFSFATKFPYSCWN
jgi:hypothetical protein